MKHRVEEQGFSKYLLQYQTRKLIIAFIIVPVMLAVQFLLPEPEKRPPLWIIPVILAPIALITVFVIYKTNGILRKFIGTEYILSENTLTIKQNFQLIKEIPIETIRKRPEGLYIVSGNPKPVFNSYRPKRSLRHLAFANTTLIPTHTTGFVDLCLE